MTPRSLLRLQKKLTSLPGVKRILPDSWYLRALFQLRIGRPLNLSRPRSFNEKLQWLKIYDRDPRYAKLVDKYAVREHIAETIGEEYLVKLLAGPYESFDQIRFDLLPERFALKCTHDSGSAVICRDKATFDYAAARAKLSRALSRNCYWPARERPYYLVPPRIIVEEYLEDPDAQELADYKLMCFNGKVKCSFVCNDRFTPSGILVTFFDRQWNRLPFERHYPASRKEIPKPENYEKMVELAETLARDLTFVRVDFYDVGGKIYFGELTLYPGGGLEEFTPEEWDYRLGEWLVLPPRRAKRSQRA